MEFITIPAVLIIVGYFVYKLFELFVCKKERLIILEHAKEFSFKDMKIPFLATTGLNLSFSPLRWGCLFLGLGIGLLIAFLICYCTLGWDVYSHNCYSNPVEIVFGGCVLLCGGLGLVVSFIIEMRMNKSRRKEA